MKNTNMYPFCIKGCGNSTHKEGVVCHKCRKEVTQISIERKSAYEEAMDWLSTSKEDAKIMYEEVNKKYLEGDNSLLPLRRKLRALIEREEITEETLT